MRITMIRGFAVIAITAAGMTTASADVLHVPRDHPTIQAAIDAAEMRDLVLVAAGTYSEAINFNGKTITVESADGPEATVIDASGLSRSVVAVTSGEGEGTTLRGFTITGGIGSRFGPTAGTARPFQAHLDDERGADAGTDHYVVGGGINVSESVLLVDNCILTGNHVANEFGAGGGFAATLLSDVVFDNCIIENNRSDWLGGGGAVSHSNIVITDCVFRRNAAVEGGGLNINIATTGTVSGTTFRENTAVNDASPGVAGGVGVYLESIAQFDLCHFAENEAEQDGGGIYTRGETHATHCTFTGNTSEGGGGIFVKGGALTLVNSILSDNQARGSGGAGSLKQGMIEIVGCSIENNTAAQGAGLEIQMNLSYQLNVTGCSFDNNIAVNAGGGILFSGPAVMRLQDSVFTHNTAGKPGGGGLYSLDHLELANVIMCGNTRNNIQGPYVDLGGNDFSEHCGMPGDLDDDGFVTVSDMLSLLAAWGNCPGQGDCPADLDDSGDVNVSDLLILLSNWG